MGKEAPAPIRQSTFFKYLFNHNKKRTFQVSSEIKYLISTFKKETASFYSFETFMKTVNTFRGWKEDIRRKGKNFIGS